MGGADLLKRGNRYDINAFEHDLKEYMYVNGGYLKEPSDRLLTTEYAEKVVDGVFTVCERHKKACERHLYDLSRQSDPNFPWVFNEDVAHSVITIMESRFNPTGGPGQHMLCQPYEHFMVGSEFGWLSKEDSKVRRFTDCLEFIARKNWKTTSAAARSLYMLTGVGEFPAPQNFFVATTEKQAKVGFDLASTMIKSGYRLKDYLINQEMIRKGAATMSPVTSVPESKDGFNPFFVVFDEIHAYTDTDMIDVYRSGRSGRKNCSPMFIYCTSGGYVEDGPLVDYLAKADNCFENFDDVIYDNWFFFINEMDSFDEIFNAEYWIKANPNICSSLSLNGFINDFRTALDNRFSKSYKQLMTKNFNFFMNNANSAYIEKNVIDDNAEVSINRESLRGRLATIGYDLADTEDFSAVTTLVDAGSGRLYVEVMSFIPQDRYDSFEDKELLNKFIAEGSLIVSGDSYTRFEAIDEYIREQNKFFKIRKCGYDRRYASTLNEKLANLPFKLVMVNQATALSEPLKTFKKYMLDRKVIFNGNKSLRWYLRNAVIEEKNDIWQLRKPLKRQKKKNDGVSSTMNAMFVFLEITKEIERAEAKKDVKASARTFSF